MGAMPTKTWQRASSRGAAAASAAGTQRRSCWRECSAALGSCGLRCGTDMRCAWVSSYGMLLLTPAIFVAALCMFALHKVGSQMPPVAPVIPGPALSCPSPTDGHCCTVDAGYQGRPLSWCTSHSPPCPPPPAMHPPDGRYCTVDAGYQGMLLELVLLTAVEHGWPLSALPAAKVAAALEPHGYDPRCGRLVDWLGLA